MKLKQLFALALLGPSPWLVPAQPPAQQAPPGQRAPSGAARLPEGAQAHRDLAYVTAGHQRQKLDLYLPKNAGAPLPLVNLLV